MRRREKPHHHNHRSKATDLQGEGAENERRAGVRKRRNMTSREQLIAFFNQIDQNKNGWMDSRELQKALSLSELHFSLTVTAQMIRVYGKAREGSITVEEFISLFTGVQTDIDAFKRMDVNGNKQLR